MRIHLTSLNEVKRAILVICPNPFNIHDAVYVRYIILLDDDGHAFWIDDPQPDEVMSIIRHLKGEQNGIAYSPCPWCAAKGATQIQ